MHIHEITPEMRVVMEQIKRGEAPGFTDGLKALWRARLVRMGERSGFFLTPAGEAAREVFDRTQPRGGEEPDRHDLTHRYAVALEELVEALHARDLLNNALFRALYDALGKDRAEPALTGMDCSALDAAEAAVKDKHDAVRAIGMEIEGLSPQPQTAAPRR